MARFGYILMTMFETQASHYFAFDVPHIRNFNRQMAKRIPDFEPMKNAYDDGDNWRIELPAGDKFTISVRPFPTFPKSKSLRFSTRRRKTAQYTAGVRRDRALFRIRLRRLLGSRAASL